MKMRHLFILGILATTVSTLALANTHQAQATDTQLAANDAYHDFSVLGPNDMAGNKHAKAKSAGVANANHIGKKKLSAKPVASKKAHSKETHHVVATKSSAAHHDTHASEKAGANHHAQQTAATTKAQKMAQAIVAHPSTNAVRQENKIAIARIDSSLQVAMRQEPSRVMANNQ